MKFTCGTIYLLQRTISHCDMIFELLALQIYQYYFLIQVSELGFAIHPSPAKHLMRPSFAFFEYFLWLTRLP